MVQSPASLRGAGFGAVLAQQRAYARSSAGRGKFGLMVPEAFVRGIRDLGYRSNGDALAELIDNALQAYADRIDVVFGYGGGASTKKPTQLAVVDNGHGMEPDMIRMAVMWGGTHRENDRAGLGRYGYGLPCASVSLGRRFTVMSRPSGGALHAVQLDLDGITAGLFTDPAGEIVVPEPIAAELPAFVTDHIAAAYPGGWPSGTVILIEKLDRLEWATAQGLRENLCRQFGVTYHKLRGEAAIYVDQLYVEPIDPLFLTPGFHLHDLDDDRAQPLDSVRAEVRDPEDGKYLGAMTLRYAWLPPSFGSVDKGRDAVGLNANPRFSVIRDFHGVIFSRNGRLIDVHGKIPWTTFINNDRYIRVEVEFSATLDELFGVTTSKQQVTVSSRIWDLLRQAGMPKAIEQLRAKVREAKTQRRLHALMPPAGARRLSEQAMGGGAPTGAGGAGNWDLGLATAAYRVAFEHLPGAAFIRIDRSAAARTLHLNTAHPFHEEVYDGPASNPEIRCALEVFLFALGDAFLDGGRLVDERLIKGWSDRLAQALRSLSDRIDAEGLDDESGWGDDTP